MADGTFPGLVSKDRDLNAITNPIYTQLTDGTIVVGVTAGALDVNISSGAVITQYSVGDVAGATDDGMLGLFVRDDVLTTLSDPDGDYTQGRTNSTGALWVKHDGDITIADGGNSITVDGTVAVSSVAGTVTVDANGSDVTVDNAAGASAVNIQDGGNSITVDGTVAATQSGVWDIGTVTTLTGITNDVNIADGGNSITVDATALDIRTITKATDSIQISANTAVNSEVNPIYVKEVKEIASGNEIHDYDTGAAVASDSTSNHDYTVTGTTFFLKSVIVSGSGSMKFEVQSGPVGSLATVAVGFLTGRQGDTQQLVFDPPIEVPVTSTGTVRVIRTNRQGSAVDVYSTILGYDV